MHSVSGSVEDIIRFNHNMTTLEDDEFVQMIQELSTNVQMISGFQAFRRVISKALLELVLSTEEPELSGHIRNMLPKHGIQATPSPSSCTLCRLPLELSYEINRFLDVKSLLRLGNTCRYLYLVSHDGNSITHLYVENQKVFRHLNELRMHAWKLESLEVEKIKLAGATRPFYDFLNNCRRLTKLRIHGLYSSTPSLAITFPPKLTSVAIEYIEPDTGDWPLFNWEECSNLEHLDLSSVVLNLSVVERVLSKLRNLTHLTCSFSQEINELPSRQQIVDLLGSGLRKLSFIDITGYSFGDIQNHLWNICITRQDILEEVRMDMHEMFDIEPLFVDWHTTEIQKLNVEYLGGVRNFQCFCTHVLRMDNVNPISVENDASCVPLLTSINVYGYNPSHGTVIAKSLQVSFQLGGRPGHFIAPDLSRLRATMDKVLDLIWCLLSADHLPKANISLKMDFQKRRVGTTQNVALYEEFSRVHRIVKSECKGRGIAQSSDLDQSTHQKFGQFCCLQCEIG